MIGNIVGCREMYSSQLQPDFCGGPDARSPISDWDNPFTRPGSTLMMNFGRSDCTFRWLLAVAAALCVAVHTIKAFSQSNPPESASVRPLSSEISYAAWGGASAARKAQILQDMAAAIQAGWVGGEGAYQMALVKALDQAVVSKRMTPPQASLLSSLADSAPPHFSHPVAYYVRRIDKFYGGGKDRQKQRVAVALMCLADVPPFGCVDFLSGR